MQKAWTALGILLAASAVHAGEPVPKTLLPRRVTLTGEMSVAAALKKLEDDTSNVLVDRRAVKSTDKVTLNLKQASYWQSVDALAAAVGAGVSVYEADGQIALRDRLSRALATSYSAMLRASVKQLSVSRHADSTNAQLTATLEFAWEPRFTPFYMEIVGVEAEYAGVRPKATMKGGGRVAVAGRNALEELVRLEAPPRTSARISSLSGDVRFVGPTDMLTISNSLPESKPFVFTTADVKVTFQPAKVSKGPLGWELRVDIEHLYNFPKFESHQFWTVNNRIHLEKGQGKSLVKVEPYQIEEARKDAGGKTIACRYLFPNTPKKGQSAVSGTAGDWRMVYVTPGRIVEFTVPFAFKEGLALP